MYKRILFVFMVMALILAACAPASRSATQAPAFSAPGAPAMDKAAGGVEMPAAAPQAASDNSRELTSLNAAGETASITQRLVIQNANLTIVVDQPPKAMDAITKMAKDMGGFVVSSQTSFYTDDNGVNQPTASITVRIPAEKLDQALSQIRGLTKDPANDVTREERTGQDVTKEYVDLQSQLKNLADTEAKLREIQASATKTEDVMNVFDRLTQVRQQIETTKGQMKYYEESAALSAVSVSILPQSSAAPVTIGGWKPAGVALDAVRALISTLKFLANLLIWLAIYVLPVVLIIGLPVWLIVRAVRKNRRKNAAAAVIPTPEQKQ